MKAKIAFTLAAAFLGSAIALIEIGVEAMISEKADEAWERVSKADSGVSGNVS